jgi:hypothetical protein
MMFSNSICLWLNNPALHINIYIHTHICIFTIYIHILTYIGTYVHMCVCACLTFSSSHPSLGT